MIVSSDSYLLVGILICWVGFLSARWLSIKQIGADHLVADGEVGLAPWILILSVGAVVTQPRHTMGPYP